MRGFFVGSARNFDFVRIERAQHGFSRFEKRSDNNAYDEDE
jgi:hypothetical protein